MQLEELVTSRELSEKLKSLGFPQGDSIFYWANDNRDIYKAMHRTMLTNINYLSDHKPIAAPLAGELWSFIPFCINDPIGDWLLYHELVNMGRNFSSCYVLLGEKPYPSYRPYDIRGSNDSNALASQLIWLVENGHVKFGDKRCTT